MKSIIFQGYFGFENPTESACQALFWPLINSEIGDMIKTCPTCLTFCKRQPSEPAFKQPVPQETWTKLAADLFQLYGHH